MTHEQGGRMRIRESYILVVDDSSTMRRLVGKFLRDMGAEHIIEAENGKKAWAILEERHVDLIVCDWNMPRMKGVDLLEKIRAHEKLSNVPFIMVTAEANREFLNQAAERGVTSYLTKPFSVRDLAEKIAGLFDMAV